MCRALDHGPRLSDEEYDRRIVALHAGLPPSPPKKQQLDVRRAELELAIDHRLGRDFPKDRRDALWAVQCRVDRKRIRLVLRYLLRRIFANGLIRSGQRLAGFLVSEYAKVLSEEELDCFFGPEEARSPELPVTAEQLRQ